LLPHNTGASPPQPRHWPPTQEEPDGQQLSPHIVVSAGQPHELAEPTPPLQPPRKQHCDPHASGWSLGQLHCVVLTAQKPPQSTGVFEGHEQLPSAWHCVLPGQHCPPRLEQSRGASLGHTGELACWDAMHLPVLSSQLSPSSQQPSPQAWCASAQQRPLPVTAPSQHAPVAASTEPLHCGAPASEYWHWPPESCTAPSLLGQQPVSLVSVSVSWV
jgi:hypothetical protein